MKNFSINPKRSVWKRNLVYAVLILFFLFILNFLAAPIKSFSYFISSPMQKFFWSVGSTSSSLGSLLNVGRLSIESQELKVKNRELLLQIASLQAIISANQAQSDISLSCQDDSFSLKMVQATGINSQDILTINKGSNEGIKKGMPVISQNKAVVGAVSEVYGNFSEVTLISNKNSAVNVEVLGSQPVEGVIKGKGGLQVFLDLVLISDIIEQGDVLVTSGLDGVFPQGLLVGQVGRIDKNDQNPHQQARITLFFNNSQDNLFVIINYKH